MEVDRALDPRGAVQVEAPVRLSNTVFVGDCSVGAFTYFNHGAEVSCARVGRYCSIGQRALIGPGEHRTDYVTTHPVASDPSGISAGLAQSPLYHASVMTAARRARPPNPPTEIGHDVWIGANAVVMQGVRIGTGAVVGAGAVVTRDVEAYAVVVGAPARRLRFRLETDIREALLASRWWELDLSHMPERDFSDPQAFLAHLAGLDLPELRPPTARVGPV